MSSLQPGSHHAAQRRPPQVRGYRTIPTDAHDGSEDELVFSGRCTEYRRQEPRSGHLAFLSIPGLAVGKIDGYASPTPVDKLDELAVHFPRYRARLLFSHGTRMDRHARAS